MLSHFSLGEFVRANSKKVGTHRNFFVANFSAYQSHCQDLFFASGEMGFKDDIQSNLRMCGKYCLWGAQTNHINVNYMKYLGH
jgi:hypothetical protein